MKQAQVIQGAVDSAGEGGLGDGAPGEQGRIGLLAVEAPVRSAEVTGQTTIADCNIVPHHNGLLGVVIITDLALEDNTHYYDWRVFPTLIGLKLLTRTSIWSDIASGAICSDIDLGRHLASMVTKSICP